MLAESQISPRLAEPPPPPQGVSVSVVVNGSLVVDGEDQRDAAGHVIRIMQGSHVIRVEDSAKGLRVSSSSSSSPTRLELDRADMPNAAVLQVQGGGLRRGSASTGASSEDCVDERSSSGASSASDHSDSDSDGQGHDSGFGELRPRGGCACQEAPTVVSVCPGNSGVRFIVSPYGADNGYGRARETTEAEMRFHVNELADCLNNNTTNRDDARIESAPSAIISGKGTVRGMKDRVRSSVAHLAYLLHREGKRDYTREEEGKVVVYTTTMGIVRKTYEQCRRVKNILHTLMVRFEERDVFMNRAHQQEVMERVCTTSVVVPQVFVDGRILGSADVIERLNETGELRQLLRPYKKTTFGKVCPQCGGYRYLPCPQCGGSKKSNQYRHNFSDMYVSLRCMNCDESGLIRCDLCLDGDC